MKDEKIYEKIRKLKKGTIEEKKIAIECEKILSDYMAKESFEEKIRIIENKLKNLK